jgi:DNA modification methylase
VTDRCTKAHEYVFLLSKSERYYFDQAAIAEDCVKGAAGSEFHTGKTGEHQLGRASTKPRKGTTRDDGGRACNKAGQETRNKRSVWTVCTRPYKGAHFATFPPALIAPMILAGCPVGGTVLDPFGGSGTTGEVSESLGRNSILIELNPDYIELQKKRTAQMGLGL